MRARLIACLAAAALAGPPAAGAATSFVVTGHGFGHGIGLSQYGAYGFARHGWTAAQILRHYYRGTTIGTVPPQPIRVLLAEGRASVQLSSEQPISVADSAGQWEVLPAGTYTLRAPLSLPGWPAQTPPMPPVLFDAGAAQLRVDGKPYRGSLSVDVAGGRLRVVNVVPLESYLLGVVPREMPASWAHEALRAQAIAARSYALASLHPDSTFDVYADTRSQVYGGAGGEDARTTAAVQATAGQVVLWHGQVAETFFHSSSGGRTATVTDVWPAAQPLPYLVSVSDPYDSVSPYHDWAPLTFTAAGAARRLAVPGLTNLAVATNRSLRASAVNATGARGTKRLDPATVQARLGLRSTWFRIGLLRLDPVAKPVTPTTIVRLTGLVRGVPGARIERKVGRGRWVALTRVGGPFTRRFRTPATALYRLTAPGIVGPAVRVTVRGAAARRTASLAALRVTLAAPTHTPRANVKWRYAVHASRAGRPVRARLTAQIVDPVGGVHPVLYANTRRRLVNWPFRGVFRDYVTWPGSSRGIPLTFRVTVVSGGTKRVLRYRVTPR